VGRPLHWLVGQHVPLVACRRSTRDAEEVERGGMRGPAALARNLMRRLEDAARLNERIIQLSKNHTINRTSYCGQILHSREEKSALLFSVNAHIMKEIVVQDAWFGNRSHPTSDLVNLSENRADNVRTSA
jgi:hypothetical protein